MGMILVRISCMKIDFLNLGDAKKEHLRNVFGKF